MDFPQAISTLYRKMHMHLNSALNTIGLTGAKAMFVFCIDEHQPMTQIDLCKCLDMDKSTVTKMLLRLEKDGLIIQITNPKDARSRLLSLTEKGKALIPEAKKIQQDWVDKVTLSLTNVERNIIFELASKVAQNADELCDYKV